MIKKKLNETWGGNAIDYEVENAWKRNEEPIDEETMTFLTYRLER